MNDTHEPEPLEDDGEDLPPPGEPPSAASPPGPGATRPGEPPREGSGELGSLWRWLGEQDWPDRPPARRWLLQRPAEAAEESALPRGFLPLGKVGMIAAAGGVGKTMALAQLAVSVATGRPWLGHYTVPAESQGPVVLALAEEDAEEVQRRLYEIRHGLGLSAEEWAQAQRTLLVLPLAGKAVQLVAAAGKDGEPQETAFFRELRQRLDEAGVDWKLLVLDPLSRWAGPETETDNFAATRFVAAIESLTQARGGPTVLVAHHTTKAARLGVGAGDATAARGASALTDGVRWVATLGKAETGLALSLVKTNYTAPASDVALKREEGGLLRVLTLHEREALASKASEVERKRTERKSGESKGKKANGKPPHESDDDAEDYKY